MFEIITLGPSHLDEVLALEGEALSGLERPDLLRRNSRDMWQSCLLPPHTAVGVVAEGKLVALAVLYLPEPGDAENLSAWLLDADCGGLRSANYKICLVHPDYRGHGLQQQLGRRLEEVARQQGIGLLCSTVSPHNPASFRSLEHLGYCRNRTLVKYGFDRVLYYKAL